MAVHSCTYVEEAIKIIIFLPGKVGVASCQPRPSLSASHQSAFTFLSFFMGCISSSARDESESSEVREPLLINGGSYHEDKPDSNDQVTRVVNRNRVPNTIINLPSPGSRPPPLVTFEDIPSPTEKERPLSPPPNTLALSRDGEMINNALQDAYSWVESYTDPNPEFSFKMNQLFTKCESHFTSLAKEGSQRDRRECDLLVEELLKLRTHLGPRLLPLATRNAFMRERITVTMGEGSEEHQFRIDCIQFFEPIVFYGNSLGKKEDLVKLYVFVVTDLKKDSVLIRYYLERSFLYDFYHVLCYFKDNNRGQLKPYGTSCPSYWTIRQDMYQNTKHHLREAVLQASSSYTLSNRHHPTVSTYFPDGRVTQAN